MSTNEETKGVNEVREKKTEVLAVVVSNEGYDLDYYLQNIKKHNGKIILKVEPAKQNKRFPLSSILLGTDFNNDMTVMTAMPLHIRDLME
jgi:hypothetical protein